MRSEEKNSPYVNIIIVNYNGKHLLKDCLSSLYKLRYPQGRFDVRLIDNSSTDGSREYIRRYFPHVEVIKNKENNYCKANNIGIEKSSGEYIALLNNDTTVDRNWLMELIKEIEADRRIGCVGSKILFPDGRIQSVGHYEFPNFYWGDRGLREPDIRQYEYLEEVNSLSGSAVLFRRDCLKDIGYLDEDFIMYLEDVDIFLRCRQRDWKLLYVPKSIVYHKFHSTADEKLVRFYIERNRLLLVAKHFPKELGRALEGGEHSLTENELFKILPDIFLKLIGSQGPEVVESVIGEFFVSLQRLYNLSKDKVVQELSNLLKGQEEKLVGIRQLEAALDQKDKEAQLLKENAQRTKAQLEATILKLGNEIEKRYFRLEELKEALNQKTQESEALKSGLGNLQHKLDLLQIDSAHKQEIFQEIEKQRDELLTQTYKRAEDINQLQEKIKQLEIERLKISLESEIEKKDIKLESESKIQRAFLEIEQKANLIKELQFILADRDKLIENLNIETNIHKTELENFRKNLQDKEKEVEALISHKSDIEHQIDTIQKELQDKTKTLSSQSQIITEKTSEIDYLQRQIETINTELRTAKEAILDKERELITKSQELEDKSRIIHERDSQISEILNSQTYRYIAIPIWRVLNLIKHILNIKSEKQKTMLVIKPYHVSTESTENALQALRNTFKNTKIVLLANVFRADYDHLINNKVADEKILYSPSYTKLTKFRLLKLLFRLNLRSFDEVILLIGPPVYQGYRKSKLLALAAGAKSVKSYFIETRTFAPLYLLGITNKIKIAASLFWRAIVFLGIILFFVAFIVIPLKIKKIFQR